jgi:hypothetical protein
MKNLLAHYDSSEHKDPMNLQVGDQIVVVDDEGVTSCGEVVSFDGSNPMVRLRKSSNPVLFDGNVVTIDTENSKITLAIINPIITDQRKTLYGMPGSKFQGHPYFMRLKHCEFSNFQVGNILTLGSKDSKSVCVGIIDIGRTKTPLHLLLLSSPGTKLIEFPLSKLQSSMICVLAEEDDELLVAGLSLLRECDSCSPEILPPKRSSSRERPKTQPKKQK